MAKSYYFGDYNMSFTYKEMKTVYDILSCGEETLATILTMGYDGDDEEGMNCDSFADYGCDMMGQLFYEIDNNSSEMTPQVHWDTFCDALKEDSYFGSCRLWHRALNIHTENDEEVDKAMYDSSVCTFLGMIESDGDNGRSDFHIVFENLWSAQFDEEPEVFPSYKEVRNWYLNQLEDVSQHFSKNFLTND